MIDVEVKYIRNSEGRKIAVYVTPWDGVPAVLSNGLGGDISAWSHIVSFFKGRIKFYSWDYRGLFLSEGSQIDGYSIPDHVDDLKTLADSFSLRKFVLFGWSMGVQVNFEFMRHWGDMVHSLVQINGVWGLPFKKAFYGKVPSHLWNLNLKIISDVIPRLRPFLILLADRSFIVSLAIRLGLVNKNIDKSIAIPILKRIILGDGEKFSRNFYYLGIHDAEDVLPKIDVPTLIISGSRDILTPLKFSIEMKNRIKNSELFVVKGGSHYVPIEFPDIVCKKIEEFLTKHKII